MHSRRSVRELGLSGPGRLMAQLEIVVGASLVAAIVDADEAEHSRHHHRHDQVRGHRKYRLVGGELDPGNAKPMASATHAIVLAVNCPPQEPAPGQAEHSISWSSASVILPTEWAPTASYTS